MVERFVGVEESFQGWGGGGGGGWGSGGSIPGKLLEES